MGKSTDKDIGKHIFNSLCNEWHQRMELCLKCKRHLSCFPQIYLLLFLSCICSVSGESPTGHILQGLCLLASTVSSGDGMLAEDWRGWKRSQSNSLHLSLFQNLSQNAETASPSHTKHVKHACFVWPGPFCSFHQLLPFP